MGRALVSNVRFQRHDAAQLRRNKMFFRLMSGRYLPRRVRWHVHLVPVSFPTSHSRHFRGAVNERLTNHVTRRGRHCLHNRDGIFAAGALNGIAHGRIPRMALRHFGAVDFGRALRYERTTGD